MLKPHHLAAVCFALLLVAGMFSGGLIYANRQESRYIHTMASQITDEMTIGEAWQRAAFHQPDLLVIYGSSELLYKPGPYQALKFFHTYPTGFDTVEIARPAINSLNLAQDLAAIGPDLRGKKVVISFTPTMFISAMAGPVGYDENFSQIHADELIFSTLLSWDLKQAAARRMLQYPKSLKKDPLLQFALERLAGGSLIDQILYDAEFPLGMLETGCLRLQDHWDVLTYIWGHPQMKTRVPRTPSQVNWSKLAAQAEKQYQQQSDNNPYGIANNVWTEKLSAVVVKGRSKGYDDTIVNNLQTSAEWGDFEILLSTLKELGAQPLILSHPFNGAFWDEQGLTLNDRNLYYDKLQSIVASYHMQLVDFTNHDEDKYFNTDSSSHTSPEGWVYVDQALDAFYHQNLH
jgi:D-alanine transfer protein